MPSSAIRCILLQLFGATIDRGVVIKPGVRVKFPWLLSVGANAWIGEDVWIDNLAPVTIGSNVCISQGAYLCTGNHDWSDAAFGLIVKPIVLGQGSWVGARSVVCPGVTLAKCAVAGAGSVVSADIPEFEVHAGNPARFVRTRNLRTSPTLVPIRARYNERVLPAVHILNSDSRNGNQESFSHKS